MSRSLATIKTMLCGTDGQEPQAETTMQLAQEIYTFHLLGSLVDNLSRIDFEVRYLLYSFSRFSPQNDLNSVCLKIFLFIYPNSFDPIQTKI